MNKAYQRAYKIFFYQLLIIVIPLLVFAIPGRLLDKKYDTAPIYLIVGILVSLGIPIVLSFVMTKKITANLESMSRRKQPGQKDGADQKDKPASK
jgi:F0F1-type ATP synthase assembly protein I